MAQVAQVIQILVLPLVLESLVAQDGHLDQFFQVTQVPLEVPGFLESLWDQVVQETQFQEYLVLLCYQVVLASPAGLEVQGHLGDLLHRLFLDYQASQVSLVGLLSDQDHLSDLVILAGLDFLPHLVCLFHLLVLEGQNQQGP